MEIRTHGEAIDAYIGDLARQSKSQETRRQYRWILNHLAADTEQHGKRYAHELTLDDYERTLNRWTDLSPSTIAQRVSCLRAYSKFLWKRGWSPAWVGADLERPRRLRPEDTPVVTVTALDVLAMLNACEDWQEFLCLTTAVYLGARRAALARVRRRDVDLVHGTVTFREKGGKVVVKPLPDEYVDVLLAAERDGIWNTPDDYLIPNRRPASVRRKERASKVIWETVVRVATRAGVRAHVHALRAAFAVAFDDAHPDQVIALKELLGHSRLETTLVYLRRKDKAKAMEAVKDLTWGSSVFRSFAEEAHTGFEPVLPA